MTASIWSGLVSWGLPLFTVAVLVVILGDLATGVLRARRCQTPLGSVGLVSVACTGRFGRRRSSTNWPNLLFTASPELLELKAMTRFSRVSVVVKMSDTHQIHLKDEIGCTRIGDGVTGFYARVYSPKRVEEVRRLLWEWGWLGDEDPRRDEALG